MDNLREQCIEIMSRVMEVDPSLIHDDTNPENLEEWDSLSHVQLVLELEKTFNITISPEEGIEKFLDFKSIIGFLQERMNV